MCCIQRECFSNTSASTSIVNLSDTSRKTPEAPHMVKRFLVCQYVDAPARELARRQSKSEIRNSTVVSEACSESVCEVLKGAKGECASCKT